MSNQFDHVRYRSIPTLILIALSMLVMFLVLEWIQVREFRLTANQITNQGGSVIWKSSASSLREAGTLSQMERVFFPANRWSCNFVQILDQIPHRITLVIQGEEFHDQDLMDLLATRQIAHLVLAGTSVSAQAIDEFRDQRPDVSFEVGRMGNQGYLRYPPID